MRTAVIKQWIISRIAKKQDHRLKFAPSVHRYHFRQSVIGVSILSCLSFIISIRSLCRSWWNQKALYILSSLGETVAVCVLANLGRRKRERWIHPKDRQVYLLQSFNRVTLFYLSFPRLRFEGFVSNFTMYDFCLHTRTLQMCCSLYMLCKHYKNGYINSFLQIFFFNLLLFLW